MGLREFFEAGRPPEGDGLTSKEWAERLGIGQCYMSRLLTRAVTQGVMQLAWKEVVNVLGRSYRAPVYQLVEKSPRGKKR